MKRLKEAGLTLLGQFALLLGVIQLFHLSFKIFPDTLIMKEVMVGDEMSNPVMSRLIYMIIGIIASVILIAVSEKLKTIPSFFTAFTAGVIMWQAVGECSWHFGFSQIEGAEAGILIVLFIALLIYAYKRKSFSWGMWSFMLSFMTNWLGHYVMIGTYRFAPSSCDEKTWFMISGIVGGTLILLIPVYIFIKKENELKNNMIASAFIYMSLGIYAGAFGAF